MSNTSASFWQRLGYRVAIWADSVALAGIGQLIVDIYQIAVSTNWKSPPLNWNFPFQEFYREQQDILWVYGPSNEHVFLPQVVLLSPTSNLTEDDISLVLLAEEFKASLLVVEALDYYRYNADGSEKKWFFDGENARLVDWELEMKRLVFQNCSYFHYLQTNLAMDYPLRVFGSLRSFLHSDRKLEPLIESKLANTTGINSLVFSNDGYMIFQKRGNNVLIRPGELCSGFSGTIDLIDIQHAMGHGARLSSLDVLREMVEELGLRRREILRRRFLGITRELIRGGTPEMFYAIDVNVSAKEILSRIPKDKEGQVKSIFLGSYATSLLDVDKDLSPKQFWQIVEAINVEGGGPVSIPLLTNLVLWYQQTYPQYTGQSQLNPW
ncbi:hypothetical protein [Chloroflexus aurantiacus]|nr:MAG: hypothetical protein D6735_15040 [Acidobacteriota bacterium]GIV94813.1 MAG: hypothetical protein KatS3mg056_3522 [Chloroflexus sp.]